MTGRPEKTTVTTGRPLPEPSSGPPGRRRVAPGPCGRPSSRRRDARRSPTSTASAPAAAEPSRENSTWAVRAHGLADAPRMVVPPWVTCAGLALPGDRPAAALDAQVIGGGTGHDEPLDLLGERQNACFSFFSSTSDFRTHSRATLPVLRRADGRGQGRVGEGMVEQLHLRLHAQDAPDRVVDPRLAAPCPRPRAP